MSSDVWEPGEAQFAHQGDELGRLDYESGPPLWAVMNPVSVVMGGLFMLKEAPQIGLLGGGAFWLTLVVPAILGAFIDIGTEVVAVAGTVPAEVTDLLGSLGSMALNLFFAPLMWMAWAGTSYATGCFVHTDELDMSRMFTGRVFVRAITFGVVSTLLAILGMSVFFVPVGGVVYGLGAHMEQVEAALVVLLLSLLVFLAIWSVFALKLWMGWMFAALDDAGPIDALTDSWFVTDLLSMAMLAVTFLVFSMANSLFMCMCLLPAWFVQAIYIPGMAVCWMRFSRGEAAAELPFFKRNPVPVLGP